jgi:hypothetical protein
VRAKAPPLGSLEIREPRESWDQAKEWVQMNTAASILSKGMLLALEYEYSVIRQIDTVLGRVQMGVPSQKIGT